MKHSVVTGRAMDPRLYLVTGDVGQDRRLVDVVRAAVAGGVTIVQLRDKYASTEQLSDTAAELREAIGGTGVPVLLNDDVDAAATADGLHVGPDDPPPDEVRGLLGPEALIGWSIHDLDQLADSARMTACDYVAVSPVWPTPTKPNTTKPFGLDGVTMISRMVPQSLPLLAIGGINADNAGSVISSGADGVAVVSAICAADDPERAARELRAVIDAALAVRGKDAAWPSDQ